MRRVASCKFKPSESTSVEIGYSRFGDAFGLEFRGRRAVVIGRKRADHVASIALIARINSVHALNTGLAQLVLQIFRGVGKLGEDQNFFAFQLFLQQFDKAAQLVIVAGFELAKFIQKFADLMQIVKAIFDNFINFIIFAGKFKRDVFVG